MKSEVAFFKNKRYKTFNAQAFVDACRAVGMTDSEIRKAMLKMREDKQPIAAEQAGPTEDAADG